MYLLQVDLATDCVDCVSKGLAKDWTGFILCAFSLVSAYIVRAVEKRRLKKENEELKRELAAKKENELLKK